MLKFLLGLLLVVVCWPLAVVGHEAGMNPTQGLEEIVLVGRGLEFRRLDREHGRVHIDRPRAAQAALLMASDARNLVIDRA